MIWRVFSHGSTGLGDEKTSPPTFRDHKPTQTWFPLESSNQEEEDKEVDDGLPCKWTDWVDGVLAWTQPRLPFG